MKQRIEQLDLAPTASSRSHRRVRAAWFAVAVMSLASASAWWLTHRIEISPTQWVLPSAASSAPAPSWKAIVEELDRMRFRAFESRDENLLRLAVEPTSPAFAQDSAALKELVLGGVEVSGLSATVIYVEELYKRWSDNREFIALRVNDVRGLYTTRREGLDKSVMKERPPRWWTVTLSRSSHQDAWRFWNVETSE